MLRDKILYYLSDACFLASFMLVVVVLGVNTIFFIKGEITSHE